MQSTTTTTPTIKWAQRKDKLFITIDVVEVTNPQIDIIDGRILKFQGADKNHTYAFEIELYDEVLREESKFALESRNIFLNIQKKNKGDYWPRLTKGTQKLNFVQVDWAYYVDEDEEDEDSKVPNFANEQGFPGFGGDDELGDEDDMPEGDDMIQGQNFGQEEKRANLDDLDQDA